MRIARIWDEPSPGFIQRPAARASRGQSMISLSVAGMALLASLGAAMTLRLGIEPGAQTGKPVHSADIGQDRAG